jgi:hypothetical protein
MVKLSVRSALGGSLKRQHVIIDAVLQSARSVETGLSATSTHAMYKACCTQLLQAEF